MDHATAIVFVFILFDAVAAASAAIPRVGNDVRMAHGTVGSKEHTHNASFNSALVQSQSLVIYGE
jgi:hypothetical protein